MHEIRQQLSIVTSQSSWSSRRPSWATWCSRPAAERLAERVRSGRCPGHTPAAAALLDASRGARGHRRTTSAGAMRGVSRLGPAGARAPEAAVRPGVPAASLAAIRGAGDRHRFRAGSGSPIRRPRGPTPARRAARAGTRSNGSLALAGPGPVPRPSLGLTRGGTPRRGRVARACRGPPGFIAWHQARSGAPSGGRTTPSWRRGCQGRSW